jgi:hypothetical protein
MYIVACCTFQKIMKGKNSVYVWYGQNLWIFLIHDWICELKSGWYGGVTVILFSWMLVLFMIWFLGHFWMKFFSCGVTFHIYVDIFTFLLSPGCLKSVLLSLFRLQCSSLTTVAESVYLSGYFCSWPGTSMAFSAQICSFVQAWAAAEAVLCLHHCLMHRLGYSSIPKGAFWFLLLCGLWL